MWRGRVCWFSRNRTRGHHLERTLEVTLKKWRGHKGREKKLGDRRKTRSVALRSQEKRVSSEAGGQSTSDAAETLNRVTEDHLCGCAYLQNHSQPMHGSSLSCGHTITHVPTPSSDNRLASFQHFIFIKQHCNENPVCASSLRLITYFPRISFQTWNLKKRRKAIT